MNSTLGTVATLAARLATARPIPLHRPWWRRLAEACLHHRPRAGRAAPADALPHDTQQPDTWSARDLRELRGLSAATLRDIGAPEWVHQGREAQGARVLDLLRL